MGSLGALESWAPPLPSQPRRRLQLPLGLLAAAIRQPYCPLLNLHATTP